MATQRKSPRATLTAFAIEIAVEYATAVGLVFAGAIAATLTTSALAQTAPAPLAKPTVEDFFRDPQMRQVRLSPDGRFLAFVVNKGASAMLVVADIDNGMKSTPVAGFQDADVGSYAWVGSERLVYTSRQSQGDRWRNIHSAGLWAVKRDGTEQRQLIHAMYGADGQTSSLVASRILPADWKFVSAPDDGSNEVLIYSGRYDGRDQLADVKLARLDITTQRRRNLDADAPKDTKGWVIDAVGEPWALTTFDGPTERIYFKNPAGGWKLWKTGGLYDNTAPGLFASDGRDLRLVVKRSAEGTEALYRVDPKTLELEAKPLIATKGFDFDGDAEFDPETRQLLGLHFENDAPTSYWFEPRLKQWQAEIDKRLPGRANHIDCRRCLRTGRLLVSSSSDQQPTQYFLFDTAKGALAMLGSSRPWIQGAQMGQRDLHRIPARDGLELPVMVTMPAGKAAGPRPAVMLVHGGPSVRGTHWTWDEEAQFLASRGYVVIEPEFRGSTGYGEKLFKAGWKQWGLAMQDDVSDALQWAVKQGWVDAKRVCIAGASYGGYAALMGLIRDPDQYRCAVSWVGVTDLNYLASDEWSDLSDVWRTYGMKTMVGDPVKDAEQLRQTSPLRRAKEIRQPVLLAYGGTDRRVTLQHGQDLRSALEAAGHRQVQYVTYNDEGHGWRKLATKVDFYGRMERFLAEHLGTGAERAAEAAPATQVGSR